MHPLNHTLLLVVVVSRTQQRIRLMGLSTALANCQDLADWLGVPRKGLYNFRPSVRPVPLEVHVAGFPGQHYCPRMVSVSVGRLSDGF